MFCGAVIPLKDMTAAGLFIISLVSLWKPRTAASTQQT